MLRKKERLKRKEFDRFFSTGTRYHSSALQVVYTPHNSFHASVVVPKKIVRKAVQRNKLRRRIYDILRNLNKEHGFVGTFIVLVKPKAVLLQYDMLKRDVRMLVGRCMKSR